MDALSVYDHLSVYDQLSVYDHLLAILSGAVLPLSLALVHAKSRQSDEPIVFDTAQKLALYWTNSAVLWILAAATILVWCLGGRTLHALGLSAPPRPIATGLTLGIIFLALYANDTWLQLATAKRLAETRARWRRQTPFMPQNGREIGHSLVLVASAAVCEEIVYRGFLIAYCGAFTGTSLIGQCAAIGLPAIVFGACHFYQGVRSVVKIVLLAGFFGAIFLFTGSLWIPIVLHFIVDLVGSLLGPKLLGPDRTALRSNEP